MKPLNVILAAGFALLTIFYACEDDMSELSQADEATLFSLRDAYSNALDENELLKTSVDQKDSLAIHLHDSLFHYHQGLFEEYHNDYSHENGHDDHQHDAQGMHMMRSTMGHGNQDGHHMNDHDLMDDLLSGHQSLVH